MNTIANLCCVAIGTPGLRGSRLRDRLIFGTLFAGVAFRLSGSLAGDAPITVYNWPILLAAGGWAAYFGFRLVRGGRQ